MTTIFADAKKGVMVCDSKATSNAGVWFPCTKVFEVRGELIGIAGDCKEGDEWFAWHVAGRAGPPPVTTDEFSAIILRKNGVFEVTAGAHEMKIERGYHGIGSGGGFAIAAFMAGADPKKAVDIACSVDPQSGGAVVVHKLK